MAKKEVIISKDNYSKGDKNVSISIYGSTDIDTASEVKKDIDNFHNYINQKYNQSDADNNSIFDTFLDYLKSLI